MGVFEFEDCAGWVGWRWK